MISHFLLDIGYYFTISKVNRCFAPNSIFLMLVVNDSELWYFLKDCIRCEHLNLPREFLLRPKIIVCPFCLKLTKYWRTIVATLKTNSDRSHQSYTEHKIERVGKTRTPPLQNISSEISCLGGASAPVDQSTPP